MPVDGGDAGAGSTSCSGGSRNNACFSVRAMFRPGGAGELYTYLPPSFSANDRVCNIAPKSDCNPTYGASVGRGAFKFTPGKRINIAIRALLNDAGKENGEIELFADGQSVISADGLVLRQDGKGVFGGIMAQTFFGGMYTLPSRSAFFIAHIHLHRLHLRLGLSQVPELLL